MAPNQAKTNESRVACDITTETITYQSPKGHGEINALLARPAGSEALLGAVLVVHENRGLNPYIEDVVRRVAKTGSRRERANDPGPADAAIRRAG